MQFSYGCMHFYILGLYQLFNFTKNDRVPRINEKFLNIQERGVFLGERKGSVFWMYVYMCLFTLTESLPCCKPCGKYSIHSISFSP